jgi:hypothetical protein
MEILNTRTLVFNYTIEIFRQTLFRGNFNLLLLSLKYSTSSVTNTEGCLLLQKSPVLHPELQQKFSRAEKEDSSIQHHLIFNEFILLCYYIDFFSKNPSQHNN